MQEVNFRGSIPRHECRARIHLMAYSVAEVREPMIGSGRLVRDCLVSDPWGLDDDQGDVQRLR